VSQVASGVATDIAGVIDEYVDFVLAEDPITASSLGSYSDAHLLGDVSPDAVAERRTRRRAYLDSFRSCDGADLPPELALDLDVAIADAATAVRREDQVQWRQRASYWYPEQLGKALNTVLTHDYAPKPERAEQLLARLSAAPGWLRDGAANLQSDAPEIWRTTALGAVKGVASFLATAVTPFSAGLPEALAADLADATEATHDALQSYAEFVMGMALDPAATWAAGGDHIDGLLQEFHLLDLDHHQLEEFGRDRLSADRLMLNEFAVQRDPGLSWQEQIARIKDRHPAPEEFLEVYRHEMDRARVHTKQAELATLPPGEVCNMAWVPEFMRSSLPIAVMHTTPPFEAGLKSEWWITPSDPTAPADRRLQQQRDNCYVFAESIAGHEIYPGHHLQKVHHKLATENSRIRRYFSSPLFVEGWGLYVEDLFVETGFFKSSEVLLYKHRNAIWRSARVVIDVGLHTGAMSYGEAVQILIDDAGMDLHMAEGEINRYCRHDSATYQSSYLLGKLALQRLREDVRAIEGDDFKLGTFHDRVMSYGSIPVSLIAQQMLRPTPQQRSSTS
jgi:uncharacterized protein (DUF885 family)